MTAGTKKISRCSCPEGRRTQPQRYLLKLFIAGMSTRSVAAIKSIKRVCRQHLGEDFDLEIVDLYREPQRALQEQIVAVPTLIKKRPAPMRRIIGSMENEKRLMNGLNVTVR